MQPRRDIGREETVNLVKISNWIVKKKDALPFKKLKAYYNWVSIPTLINLYINLNLNDLNFKKIVQKSERT